MEMKEVLIIVLAAIILGLSAAFPNGNYVYAVVAMFLILVVNVAGKMWAAHYYDSSIKLRFWEWYQYYWGKKSHFKKPLPMFWIAPLLSLISLGYIVWLAIVEFDVAAKPERVAKRHGLWRFSEMTDIHIGAIAAAGIAAVLALSILSYIVGFGYLTRLSVFFCAWSLLPLGSLDGSKILFGSRVLWMSMLIIVAIFFSFAVFIV